MDDDISLLLEKHRNLRNKMPHAWNAFFAGFGNLRPIQLSAIPEVLSGKNVLVTAPTAGGKTEAAVAPLCEKIASEKWKCLSVLLITPTRALVNDLFQRLCRPLELMNITLGRKTADHAISEQLSEQVLITTPESLESLLTLRRETITSVRAIILDEIHLLDGSPRGDQLRAILNRFSVYQTSIDSKIGCQRIAMSATVADPRRLANVYLGENAEVVSVSGQRELEARVITIDGVEQDRAEAAMREAESFGEVNKILIFVNSRKQVDICARYFQHGRFAKMPVFGHHGSLSKSTREDTESRFKEASQAICVATMTLEVGIDIGDIDLVICMDPPFSLSSFLQRIGRGCRRLNGRTRVLCVARDVAGEIMFQALIYQASRGVPAGPLSPFRHSVLIQQILAYLRQVPKHQRIIEQFEKAFLSQSAPPITQESLHETLADMVSSRLLAHDRKIYTPDSDGWNFIESTRLFSNIQPNPLTVALVDVDSGKVVANVAGVNSPSGGIRIAGRSYELIPGSNPNKLKVRGGGEHDGSPSYHACSLPYAFDIGASLANYFGIEPNALAVIPRGDCIVVMTWLGHLLNAILAEGIKQDGIDVGFGSFHLVVKTAQDCEILKIIQKAVRNIGTNNPLSRMRPERMVDVGPYFQMLSPSLQKKAKEAWLDIEYTEKWIDQIEKIETIPLDSDLATEMIALT